VLRQLVTDRRFLVGSALLLVTIGLLVLTVFVPESPVMSASGPAVFVAVIGAITSRSL
jgi:hypothetical protein